MGLTGRRISRTALLDTKSSYTKANFLYRFVFDLMGTLFSMTVLDLTALIYERIFPWVLSTITLLSFFYGI